MGEGTGVRGDDRPSRCGSTRRLCDSCGTTVLDRLLFRTGSRGSRRPRARHRRPPASRRSTSPRSSRRARLSASPRGSRACRDPLRRAGRGARRPRRARAGRPSRQRPAARVGLRGHAVRRGAGLDPGRRERFHHRGRRHRRRSHRAGPRGQDADGVQRPQRLDRCARRERPRHVRRLARRGRGREPRGHRRVRRRRAAARDQGGTPDRTFTDVDEASAIFYAVDHGARIINLSFGGPAPPGPSKPPSPTRQATGFCWSRRPGTKRRTATRSSIRRRCFNPWARTASAGSVSQSAPRPCSAARPPSRASARTSRWSPRREPARGAPFDGLHTRCSQIVHLPRSAGPATGWASGTSFAAPQVSGAAALVWAANPSLSAQDVATILKQTASGDGSWTPTSAATACPTSPPPSRTCAGMPFVVMHGAARPGRDPRSSWHGHGVSTFRLTVSRGRRPRPGRSWTRRPRQPPRTRSAPGTPTSSR